MYRILAVRVGNGARDARAHTLFRKLVNTGPTMTVESDTIRIRLGRRAYNP